MRELFIFTTFMVLFQAQVNSLSEFMANQTQLYDDLFKNYNPDIGCVNTIAPKSPYILNIESGMFKLVKIVEAEESVTFLFDLILTWHDERLEWHPDDYGGINHIYVPLKNVWVPELTIVDSTDQKSFLEKDMLYAWIYNNGSVSFYHSSIVTTICEMDVFRFPMDKHTCSINVIYHSYEPGEFEILAEQGLMPRPIRTLGNGEWQMESMGVRKQIMNDNKTLLNLYEATFHRNPSFYITLIIIPAYFINALSIVALFHNLEARGEKYQIGMTNIMSMSFIMVILADDLPKTKNIPLLAIFVIVCLALMLAALACALIIPKVTPFLIKYNRTLPRKISLILMYLLQIANFINFIVLFI
ncbi:unnamed protein product [Caenorhabditis angaria]|uniref:Neurotransmitter-gated ion-channel ligand-binding domain-containing protein n=1 Tax=Caenorhabditis angaria TaxID=860376 RepID=A0A9P1IYU8_9PELO|nr:unnamed protein product [Caenorhabditis angaria]